MKLDDHDKFDWDPVQRLLMRNRERVHPFEVSFAGLSLQIEKDVFSPDLTQTSALMLACLRELEPGWRVLDVFTGSGVFAVYAASKGCGTVAIDQSPHAVQCALNNAHRNGVGHLVDVRLGDTLVPLRRGEVFDFVIACPPLLPGTPTDPLEAAVVDPGLSATIRFLIGLPRHLAPRGRAFLILSDVFARIGYDLTALCAERDLQAAVVRARNVNYETYTVYELRHHRAAA